MSKKRGLGKGLASLIGDSVDAVVSKADIQRVAIDRLVPNVYQPRKKFEQAALEALAESIKLHGIIQPLAVRPLADKEGFFEIIAGERRFRASQLAGLHELPVIVHDVSDADSAAFALIENLQREDLNVIEKAKGIKKLIEEFSLTHEACGRVLAQSRSSISNTLRLLDLSECVQSAVIAKDIEMGHARALLPLESDTQGHLLQQVRLKGLTVRETEAMVKGYKNNNAQPVLPSKKVQSEYVKAAEASLAAFLGAKVSILQKEQGQGKITVAFESDDMLKQLCDLLSNENH